MYKGGAVVLIFPLCEYVSQFQTWIIRMFQFSGCDEYVSSIII